jgi:hypothetical protein
MPYWIHAKIKDSAFSVVVETAKDALAKLAELADFEHIEVSAKDLLGNVLDPATLQSEADQS